MKNVTILSHFDVFSDEIWQNNDNDDFLLKYILAFHYENRRKNDV